MHDSIVTALLRWTAASSAAAPLSTSHVIADSHDGARITQAAGALFGQLGSKSQSRNAIKAGHLTLNGDKHVETSRRVKAGDVLEYTPPPIWAADQLTEEKLDALARFTNHLIEQGLRTVHEDDDLAVVFKPAGVHTKSGTNRKFAAFEDAIPATLSPPPLDKMPLPKPLVMHRLDVPVSGLCVVAKTRPAALHLAKQFEQRRISKWYHALVVGVPNNEPSPSSSFSSSSPTTLIDAPIGGLPSQTEVQLLSMTPHPQWGHLTRMRMKPITGRTHQLRIHAAAELECPIVGDDLYWDFAGDHTPPLRKGGGLFLQSCGVRFEHLDGSELTVCVQEPRKFGALQARGLSGVNYLGDDHGASA